MSNTLSHSARRLGWVVWCHLSTVVRSKLVARFQPKAPAYFGVCASAYGVLRRKPINNILSNHQSHFDQSMILLILETCRPTVCPASSLRGCGPPPKGVLPGGGTPLRGAGWRWAWTLLACASAAGTGGNRKNSKPACPGGHAREKCSELRHAFRAVPSVQQFASASAARTGCKVLAFSRYAVLGCAGGKQTP